MNAASRALDDEHANAMPGPLALTVGTLNRLPEMMRAERLSRGLSIRQAATEIGVSFSTLDRLERGA